MMTLDRKYRDDLVKALRVHEISGTRIGEVVAEVEAHVTETGEDPVEAFGKPRDYARQVVAQLDTATGKRSTGAAILTMVAGGALAMFGQTFWGDGLSDAPTVGYTLRDVVAQPALLVVIVLACLLAFRAYTASSHNKAFGGAAAVVVALGVASQILCNKYLDDRTPLIEAPTWLILTLGILFLIALFTLLGWSIRRGRVRYPNKGSFS